MAKRNRIARIGSELFELRQQQKQILSNALGGLRIHDVDIDRIYAKKLRNINLLDEFKIGGNK